MRIFLLFVSLIVAGSLSAQTKFRTYTFKEVGMTIRVPDVFKEVNKAEDSVSGVDGAKMLTESSGVNIEHDETITLLSVEASEGNYLNITQVRDSGSAATYQVQNEAVKRILYKTMSDQFGDAKIDTASSTARISGHEFNRFQVRISITPAISMTLVLYAGLIKGYDFGFCYTYLDRALGQKLEAILRTAVIAK